MAGEQPLEYASGPPLKRPPMYSLVLGVLAAGFLIVFGGGVGIGVAAMSYQRIWLHDQWVNLWGVLVLLPMSAVFLGAGIVTMYSTVCALRGLPPKGRRMTRWIGILGRVRLG